MELLSYVNNLKTFKISDVLVTPTVGQRVFDERSIVYRTFNMPDVDTDLHTHRNTNILSGRLEVDDRDIGDYVRFDTPVQLPEAVDLTILDTVPADRMAMMSAISTPLRTAPALSDRMIEEVRQAVRDAIGDVIRGASFVTDANVEDRTVHATIQFPAMLERIETTISLTPSGED